MVKQIMFRYTYIDAYQKQQQTKMFEISKIADGENVDTSLACCVVVVVAFPLLGLRVGSSFSFPHCTHLLQSAHLRLRRRVCRCMVSACFRTPRLSLGHPGSFRSAHDLKCMRTQTGPRFNVPSERRGITTFSNTQSHGCTVPGPGIEPGPLP